MNFETFIQNYRTVKNNNIKPGDQEYITPIKVADVNPKDRDDAISFLQIIETHRSICMLCEWYRDNLKSLTKEEVEYYEYIKEEGFRLEAEWLPIHQSMAQLYNVKPTAGKIINDEGKPKPYYLL